MSRGAAGCRPWLAGDDCARGCGRYRGQMARSVDYGAPLGLPGLRQLIARRMGDRGIEHRRPGDADESAPRPSICCAGAGRAEDTCWSTIVLFQLSRPVAGASRQYRRRALYLPAPISRRSARCWPNIGRGSTSPIRQSTTRPGRRFRRWWHIECQLADQFGLTIIGTMYRRSRAHTGADWRRSMG